MVMVVVLIPSLIVALGGVVIPLTACIKGH